VALSVPVLDVAGSRASVVRAHGWVVASRCAEVGGVRLLQTRGGLRLDVADAGSPERSTQVPAAPRSW